MDLAYGAWPNVFYLIWTHSTLCFREIFLAAMEMLADSSSSAHYLKPISPETNAGAGKKHIYWSFRNLRWWANGSPRQKQILPFRLLFYIGMVEKIN